MLKHYQLLVVYQEIVYILKIYVQKISKNHFNKSVLGSFIYDNSIKYSISQILIKGSKDIDLNAMFRFMVENFVVKTEPHLSVVDILRLTPFVGNQLKEILPNPFTTLEGDEEKND